MTQTRSLFFLAAAVVVVGLFAFTGVFAPPAPIALELEPTNFVEVGTLKTVSTGSQDALVFVYGEEGAPKTEISLEIDADTICVQQSGALPCVAMSSLYSAVFEGKTAVVEGVEKELRLKVKTVRIAGEGETENIFLPPKGLAYVSWPKAREIIQSCTVVSVNQTEDLAVHIGLKDGRGIISFEPVAGELVELLKGSSCYVEAKE
ncbi:MAG: hypothetical protein V4674_01210 [Patescibacteria group bacterium]